MTSIMDTPYCDLMTCSAARKKYSMYYYCNLLENILLQKPVLLFLRLLTTDTREVQRGVEVERIAARKLDFISK